MFKPTFQGAFNHNLGRKAGYDFGVVSASRHLLSAVQTGAVAAVILGRRRLQTVFQ